MENEGYSGMSEQFADNNNKAFSEKIEPAQPLESSVEIDHATLSTLQQLKEQSDTTVEPQLKTEVDTERLHHLGKSHLI